MRDPRLLQIAALSGLLLYGIVSIGMEVSGAHVLVALGSALVTQWVASFHLKLRFDPRSALISGLSLCLLLRSAALVWVLVAAVVTIASKFLIRVKDRHVFNPTCFGLVALLLVTDQVWVSAGQWGGTALGAMFVACLGILVVSYASRSDVTIAFLLFFAALLFGRAWWLGDPMNIPLHQLENGALILFAFFMISDPKTTPDTRLGRIAFAGLVAMGAYFVTFVLYEPNGLLFSLAIGSVAARLIDIALPGPRYSWPTPTPTMEVVTS